MHYSSEDSLLRDMMLLDSSPNGDRALIPQARSHWGYGGRRGLSFSQAVTASKQKTAESSSFYPVTSQPNLTPILENPVNLFSTPPPNYNQPAGLVQLPVNQQTYKISKYEGHLTPVPKLAPAQQPIKYEDVFSAVGPAPTLEDVQGQDPGQSWRPLAPISPPVPATSKCLTPAQSRLNTNSFNPSIPVQMCVPRSNLEMPSSITKSVSHPATTPAYIVNMSEPVVERLDVSNFDVSVGIAPKLCSRPTSRLAGTVISHDGRTLDSKSVSDGSMPESNPRFKTEICRNFKEKGSCLYGDECQFAHGSQDVREVGRQNKYKTKLCQKYWISGYCAYGPRCNFVHCDQPSKEKTKETISSLPFPLKSCEEDVAGGSGGVPANLQIPVHGSGRLASFKHQNNNKLGWFDIWTQKIVC